VAVNQDDGNMHRENYYAVVGRRVRRALPGLLLLSVALGTLSYLVAQRMGGSYEAHFSYWISLREREISQEYRFDGYYALQATELFAETLAAAIKTPGVIAQAQGEKSSQEVRGLLTSVEARQEAPQLVAVVAKGTTGEEARLLAEGLQGVVREQISHYFEQGDPALRFEVVATEVWVGERAIAARIVGLTVLVLTLFLGINWVLFWEAVKQKR
jgi:hypothetical protein